VKKAQRCRVLLLAIGLGILLPTFERTWIALGAALFGLAILTFLYWRECRHTP
jgi:hypothetical protein